MKRATAIVGLLALALVGAAVAVRPPRRDVPPPRKAPMPRARPPIEHASPADPFAELADILGPEDMADLLDAWRRGRDHSAPRTQ